MGSSNSKPEPNPSESPKVGPSTPTKRDYPSDFKDAEEYKSWIAQVREDVAKQGMEKAMMLHMDKIETTVYEKPKQFERLVVDWMYRDSTLKKKMPSLPRNKAPEDVSYEEAHEMRRKVKGFKFIPSLSRVESQEQPEPPSEGPASTEKSDLGSTSASTSDSDEDGGWSRCLHKKKHKKKKAVRRTTVEGVDEENGEPVVAYRQERFQNWGCTVQARPQYTFEPRTVKGIQNIVLFAKRENLRVRVAGSTHSWSSVYGEDNEILLRMAPRRFATGGATHPPNEQDIELEKIEFISEISDGASSGALIKVGAAAISDHFREWALDDSANGGQRKWALRALPVLVEITFGGNISTICHGAGITSPSVSDLVHEVTFVNFNGELQSVKDPDQLKAAAGCFGLLGIITRITLRADPFTHARFFPRKVLTPLAIPPVDRSDVPTNQNDFSIDDVTSEQLAKAEQQFLADTQKFYSEWFWFPFQKNCWINAWNNDAAPDSNGEIYPDAKEVRKQNKLAALFSAFENTLLQLIPPLPQARLLGSAAMLQLPAGEEISTPTTEILHFQRGIHRIRVRDFEVEIPIPGRAGNPTEPDFDMVKRAWWMAIDEVYKQLPRVPMRTTLEMRLIGSSEMIMSTQRNNTHGTLSIEVLTNLLTEEEEWETFKQAILDRWASLKDPTTGEPLRIRPHWAKEWEGLSVRGQPVIEYLKNEAYVKAIPEFKDTISAVAAAGGYSAADAFSLFGNDLILDIIGE